MHRMKFTVLIWTDHQQRYTAKAVECAGAVATDHSSAAAIEQLKKYIAYLYREEPWTPPPDFIDPSLREVTVAVRPGYETQQRVYPCSQLVELTVPVLLGRRRSGTPLCAIPTLDVYFGYHAEEPVDVLVREHVKRKLDGQSHQRLALNLPPASLQIREVIVPVKESAARDDGPDIPQLRLVAEPIGERAIRKRFSAAWEREPQLRDLTERLQQKRSSLVLIGPRGVGKTTLVVNAVRQVERKRAASQAVEDDPIYRFRHRHWISSGAKIIAGMRYLGEWQQRCEEIIEELDDIQGVLCIENLLDLLRAGGDDPTAGLAAFLLPYLERQELRLVTESTLEEFAACRRLLPGLADVLQVVRVPEFTPQQSVRVLQQLAESRRQEWSVQCDDTVVDTTYGLFHRFMPYQTFPGKAVPFLNSVLERARREGQEMLSSAAVIDGFVKQTGLPDEFLRDEVVLNQESERKQFESLVFGQPAACAAAAELVTIFKAGLNDPGRPLGVLLFCGPTGVGKTEMAKVICRRFFGDSERMVRLDMSEYSGYAAAERLIVGPNGQPSELVRRIREQPFSVVLLDEIEKAADDVFDTLLSVFDEGRLTDRYGRTTIFRSAILIMTSNLGAQRQSPIGYDGRDTTSYERDVQNFFRPEFFNRIDRMVTFAPLAPPQIRQIAIKELIDLTRREGIEKANLRLTWEDRVVDFLVRTGFDPRFGARPLQRTVERRIVTPLSRWLVENPHFRNASVQLTMEGDAVRVIPHRP